MLNTYLHGAKRENWRLGCSEISVMSDKIQNILESSKIR